MATGILGLRAEEIQLDMKENFSNFNTREVNEDTGNDTSLSMEEWFIHGGCKSPWVWSSGDPAGLKGNVV